MPRFVSLDQATKKSLHNKLEQAQSEWTKALELTKAAIDSGQPMSDADFSVIDEAVDSAGSKLRGLAEVDLHQDEFEVVEDEDDVPNAGPSSADAVGGDTGGGDPV